MRVSLASLMAHAVDVHAAFCSPQAITQPCQKRWIIQADSCESVVNKRPGPASPPLWHGGNDEERGKSPLRLTQSAMS